MVSLNIKKISEPLIPMAISWSNDYDGKYGEIIDMSQAVPSYPPHPKLIEEFINTSSVKSLLNYGDIEGEKILRKNYSNHINQKYGTNTGFDQILITSGCNQAFIASIICVANEGDEIMISNPGYFSHELSLRMLNIKPKYFNLNREKNFEIDFRDLESKITSKVKAIVIVNPGNPTGSSQDKTVLDEILKLCIKKNKYLIIDETYRDFIYPDKGAPHNLFSIPNWSKNLIQLYSFSKSCCIPGHRLGAITTDKELISQISKIMDNIQICAPRPAQHSVAKFLPHLENFVNEKSNEIETKANLFSKSLFASSKWEITSIGSFFAYVKHSYNNIKCDDIAKLLAKNCGLITIPGIYFGKKQENFLRMSIAGLSLKEIASVKSRLEKLEKYI